MEFTHYVITRFNEHLYSKNPYKVANPDAWMEHRLNLFEACKESVLSQGVPFIWVIAVDENTPQHFLDRIFTDDCMVKITCPVNETFSVITPPTEWIISTRIDNDDTYYPNALNRIQQTFKEEEFVIDIDYHQDLNGAKSPSYRRAANSPFLSLVENSNGGYKSCYARPHTKMVEDFKAMKIPEQLANMILHDKNQCNYLLKV